MNELLTDSEKQLLAQFRQSLGTPEMRWALKRARDARPPIISVASSSRDDNADRAAIAHGWELAISFLEKDLPNSGEVKSENPGYIDDKD